MQINVTSQFCYYTDTMYLQKPQTSSFWINPVQNQTWKSLAGNPVKAGQTYAGTADRIPPSLSLWTQDPFSHHWLAQCLVNLISNKGLSLLSRDVMD